MALFRWLRSWFCHRRQPALESKPLEQASDSSSEAPSETSSAASSAISFQYLAAEDPRAHLIVLCEDSAYIGLIGLLPPEIGLREDSVHVRWYAVWGIKGEPASRVAGIHWGEELRAYRALLALSDEGFKGISWKRHYNRTSAAEEFRQGVSYHQLDPSLADRVIGWVHTQ